MRPVCSNSAHALSGSSRNAVAAPSEERGSSDPRVRGDHLHRCGTVQASRLRLSSKHGADRPALFTDRASFASVVMVRYALHASRNEISGGKMADVTQADHADHPPALVDNRQPADLQRLHVMHRLSLNRRLPGSSGCLRSSRPAPSCARH